MNRHIRRGRSSIFGLAALVALESRPSASMPSSAGEWRAGAVERWRGAPVPEPAWEQRRGVAGPDGAQQAMPNQQLMAMQQARQAQIQQAQMAGIEGGRGAEMRDGRRDDVAAEVGPVAGDRVQAGGRQSQVEGSGPTRNWPPP